jgi:proteasome lid subunit RPN8/RPN11
MKCGISRALLERLRTEAEAAGAAEICGLLLGDGGSVTEAVPLRNVHPAPTSGFLFDPEAQLAASRAARGAGKSIVGHYHSHPSGDAAPSAADAALAEEEGVLWLILTTTEARLWISTCNGSVAGAFEPVVVRLQSCALQPEGAQANREDTH